MLPRLWTVLRREPLVHFALLAGLLFAVNAVAIGDGRTVIRVDAATRNFLIKQKQDLLLRPLTPAEQAAEINAWTEDEILWREARRQGLDNNAWFRGQLIQNLRTLIAGEIEPPGEATLRAFYLQNPSHFARPATIDLEHAYFTDADQIPQDAAERLRRGTSAVGDIDPLIGQRFFTANQDQLVGLFGAEAARAVLAIHDGAWHGSIAGARGSYFVRVTTRHPSETPGFAEVHSWVEMLWTMAQQQQRLEAALGEMRKRYRVLIDPPLEPAPNQAGAG
jgi:hypothetical protein